MSFFIPFLISIIFSTTTFAKLPIPKGCMDIVDSEMPKYGLGSFDHPGDNVEKIVEEGKVTFRSKNIYLYVMAGVEDEEGVKHPYTVILSKGNFATKIENVKLYLNNDCSAITDIGFGDGVLMSASNCQHINAGKINALNTYGKEQFKRAPLNSKIYCKEYQKKFLTSDSKTADQSSEELKKLHEKRQSNCEEITEQYVICNGNRYVLDLKNQDGLNRDVKKIEEYLNIEKFSPEPRAVLDR